MYKTHPAVAGSILASAMNVAVARAAYEQAIRQMQQQQFQQVPMMQGMQELRTGISA
ncbi:MAG: hypothetical protein GWO08_06895 [Gammaproteobacteria bacterium]|nr:hypothetical protein [Gammaproteobacteria bacterium]